MRFRRTPGAAERGFSLIEALIAAALIGAVAIGIIPLFTRAMTDNLAGSDYTRVTNFAKSKEEDFARMPFTEPVIQITSGSQLLSTEFYNSSTLQWSTVKPTNPLLDSWTRVSTITQYNIYDSDDDQMFDFPLPSGSPPDEVQIMQQQVQVKSIASMGPAGAHKTTIIRFLKAF